MKTLLHDFAPMVSQLSEMLGQMYSTIPQASALDLTRQVHTRIHVHTQTHISILLLILCSYMQSDFRDLSERAVYELISYASMSPRLMRILSVKLHPQLQLVFMTKLSSIICLAT